MNSSGYQEFDQSARKTLSNVLEYTKHQYHKQFKVKCFQGIPRGADDLV